MKFLTKLKWIFVVAPKEKIIALRDKRRAKLFARYTNPVDIKYRGPFSYRYLRIIGWICFAIGQLTALYGIFSKLGWDFLPNVGTQTFVSFISFLATPLFIVAAFGLILSGRKTFKQMIILYAGMYIAMGVGLNIFYYRYMLGIFNSHKAAGAILSNFGFIVKLNVFGDLLAFCLFHYFINYTPKKYFQGKKIILFRLLSILPALFVGVSYLVKVLAAYGYIGEAPFAFIPFLATKPPLALLIFALLSIWIKYRERLFKSLGLTKKEHDAYIKTNRNSLSISIALSTMIAIAGVIEILIIVILFASLDKNWAYYHILCLDIGETIPLILIIPFIMLYSYTRVHKDGPVDILVPMIGVGMTAIVYIEVIYQYFVQCFWA